MRKIWHLQIRGRHIDDFVDSSRSENGVVNEVDPVSGGHQQHVTVTDGHLLSIQQHVTVTDGHLLSIQQHVTVTDGHLLSIQ